MSETTARPAMRRQVVGHIYVKPGQGRNLVDGEPLETGTVLYRADAVDALVKAARKILEWHDFANEAALRAALAPFEEERE